MPADPHIAPHYDRCALLGIGTQVDFTEGVATSIAGTAVMTALRPTQAPTVEPSRLLAAELQEIGPRETVMFTPRWRAFHRTTLEAHLTALGVDTVVLAGCTFPTARGRPPLTPPNGTSGSSSPRTRSPGPRGPSAREGRDRGSL